MFRVSRFVFCVYLPSVDDRWFVFGFENLKIRHGGQVLRFEDFALRKWFSFNPASLIVNYSLSILNYSPCLCVSVFKSLLSLFFTLWSEKGVQRYRFSFKIELRWLCNYWLNVWSGLCKWLDELLSGTVLTWIDFYIFVKIRRTVFYGNNQTR